jgi:two-component system, NarL family, response regulator LiaR
LDSLTLRETEILGLVSRGKTNREMAHILMVSRSTVKTHVQHILRKLGANTRTEAAVLAMRSNLIDWGPIENPGIRVHFPQSA